MGIILCATRGGEASIRTQDQAIALAEERGDILLFLYIVNLRFLDKMAAPIVVDVADEVSDMGEFFLLMAKERAEEQGISARTMVRKGEVREEIKKAALEVDASLIILGRPAGEESAFQLASLQAFAAEIENQTGVKAVIV